MITMAHNLHILLGDLAEQSIYRFKEYVIKYGKEYSDDKGRTVDNFMRLMLWKDDNLLYEALQSEPDKSVFNPDIDIYTKATLVALKDNINVCGDDLKKQLRFTLKEIFRNTVNVNNPGDDTLHVFISHKAIARRPIRDKRADYCRPYPYQRGFIVPHNYRSRRAYCESRRV